MARAEQHAAAAGVDVGSELGNQAALAHPCLGGDDDDQRVPGLRQLPLLAQHLPLGGATDERGVVGEQGERRRQRRRTRRGRRRRGGHWSGRRSGVSSQLPPVGDAELAQECGDVRLHRALGDVQP